MVVDLLGAINERDYQDRIVELGRTFGWRAAHFGTANTGKGFRTPVRYDGKGFPDLVLVHPKYGVLFRELKTDTTQLSADQEAWRDSLLDAGADWDIWRPRDMPMIKALLSFGRAAA
jgi:hypothetical protein